MTSIVYFEGTAFDATGPNAWLNPIEMWDARVPEASYGGEVESGKVRLPLVPVILANPSIEASAQSLGLVDTGAIGCAVSQSMIEALSLRSVEESEELGPGGHRPVRIYQVVLSLPDIGFQRLVKATGMVNIAGFDFLIGHAVLRHLRFTANGPAGTYSLAVP